jgi:hypothetical protein
MRRADARIPSRWWGLPIKHANVRVASFFGLMESTPEAAPLSGPMTLDTWLAAAKGDASGLWFQSLLGDFAFPTMTVWGQRAAAARLDAQAAREYFADDGQKRGSNLGRDASAFVWGGGSLIDGWPAAADEDEYSRVRRSNTETSSSAGRSTSRRRRRSRRRSSCRICRTATRSCSRDSGTRRPCGRSNAKPALI